MSVKKNQDLYCLMRLREAEVREAITQALICKNPAFSIKYGLGDGETWNQYLIDRTHIRLLRLALEWIEKNETL